LKRILLFSILFLILVVGLFYYVLPKVLYRPRRDTIPSSAHVVPWMRPNPSVDALAQILPWERPWDLDAAMSGAWKITTTFRIAVPSGTRVIPSTVYLGHDAEYLYVGGRFSGMGTNPNSNAAEEYMNFFYILFDVAGDGVLSFPESGSDLGVIVPVKTEPQDAGWHTRLALGYEDNVWQDDMSMYRPAETKGGWNFAENIGMHIYTVGNAAAEYDNSTGTLVILFSRHLSRPGYYTTNALQMKPEECWVMGFLLELGFSNLAGPTGDPYADYVDGWPQKGYPYLSNNASWWPKLAIDLSNPPPPFQQQPGQVV